MDNLESPIICNNSTICSPTNTSIWHENSWNIIKWNIFDTLYINYDKLDIYFYYRENYQYYNTFNINKIPVNKGFQPIFLNNTYFNKKENNTLYYSILVIGEGINPNDELNNTLSKWKPINFKITNKTNITNID